MRFQLFVATAGASVELSKLAFLGLIVYGLLCLDA